MREEEFNAHHSSTLASCVCFGKSVGSVDARLAAWPDVSFVGLSSRVEAWRRAVRNSLIPPTLPISAARCVGASSVDLIALPLDETTHILLLLPSSYSFLAYD